MKHEWYFCTPRGETEVEHLAERGREREASGFYFKRIPPPLSLPLSLSQSSNQPIFTEVPKWLKWGLTKMREKILGSVWETYVIDKRCNGFPILCLNARKVSFLASYCSMIVLTRYDCPCIMSLASRGGTFWLLILQHSLVLMEPPCIFHGELAFEDTKNSMGLSALECIQTHPLLLLAGRLLWGPPDMMSTSEGGGDHGIAAVVAWLIQCKSRPNSDKGDVVKKSKMCVDITNGSSLSSIVGGTKGDPLTRFNDWPFHSNIKGREGRRGTTRK